MVSIIYRRGVFPSQRFFELQLGFGDLSSLGRPLSFFISCYLFLLLNLTCALTKDLIYDLTALEDSLEVFRALWRLHVQWIDLWRLFIACRGVILVHQLAIINHRRYVERAWTPECLPFAPLRRLLWATVLVFFCRIMLCIGRWLRSLHVDHLLLLIPRCFRDFGKSILGVTATDLNGYVQWFHYIDCLLHGRNSILFIVKIAHDALGLVS